MRDSCPLLLIETSREGAVCLPCAPLYSSVFSLRSSISSRFWPRSTCIIAMRRGYCIIFTNIQYHTLCLRRGYSIIIQYCLQTYSIILCVCEWYCIMILYRLHKHTVSYCVFVNGTVSWYCIVFTNIQYHTVCLWTVLYYEWVTFIQWMYFIVIIKLWSCPTADQSNRPDHWTDGLACVRPVSCWTAFIVIQQNKMAAIAGRRYTTYLTTDSVLPVYSGAELHIYFLVCLESIYYQIFFYSKIVPNCAVAK